MEEIDYNGFLVKKLQCPSYGFLYCSSVILSHQCITINQLAHTIFHLESSYACTLSPIWKSNPEVTDSQNLLNDRTHFLFALLQFHHFHKDF